MSEPDFTILQVHDAPVQTAERIRARCQAALESQHPRPVMVAWRRWLEPALAIAASAVYVAAAISSSVHLLRLSL